MRAARVTRPSVLPSARRIEDDGPAAMIRGSQQSAIRRLRELPDVLVVIDAPCVYTDYGHCGSH